MAIGLNKKVLISCLAVTTLVGLAGCGAGSKTAEKTSTKVACDFTKPAAATTVNLLAYNSSAVDPYSNTMVSSCSRENVTVKHDPIDFPGQVQKTFVATQIGQNLPLLQQAAAATILLTLPVIAIAFVAQKYLVAGLNSGAVKG